MFLFIAHKNIVSHTPDRGVFDRKFPTVAANERTRSLEMVWTSGRSGLRCQWVAATPTHSTVRSRKAAAPRPGASPAR